MADPTAPPATDPPADPPVDPPKADPPKGDPPKDQTVPYDRFKEVNDKAREAEEKAQELAAKLEEREQAELSAKERAEKRAEKAEQKAQEAESKAQRLERGGWLREQARKAGFHDPSDAVSLIDTSSVESEDDAKAKVKTLAEGKPHLLMGERERQALGSLMDSTTEPEVPVNEKGEPDVKAGLGKDLLKNLVGRQ